MRPWSITMMRSQMSSVDIRWAMMTTVALEDNFAEAFKESRGKVDPELKLGF